MREYGHLNYPVVGKVNTETIETSSRFGLGMEKLDRDRFNPEKVYEAMGVALVWARKMSEHFLKFKTENGVASVNANHIMYSEAHDHYQYVKKDDGEEIKVRMTVTELFTILSKYGGFVRIGSAYIVNLRHVKNVTPTNVCLYSNINIQIPRGKFTEIKNTFWNFQCEGEET